MHGFHVAGIYGRFERIGLYLQMQALQLRHIVLKLVEIEIQQSPRFRVLYHTYGSARIDEQYGWLRCIAHCHLNVISFPSP